MNTNKKNPDDSILDDFRKTFRWYIEKGYKFDSIPEQERNSEKAIALLERANEHLKSAKAVLKKNNHRDVIFHSQQCVELLGKSLLLISGLGSKDEFKSKIGHNFFKYMINKLRKMFSSINEYLDIPFYADTIKSIDQYFGSKDPKKEKSTSLDFNNYTEVEETFDGFFSDFQKILDILNQIDFYQLTKNGSAQTINIIYEEAENQLKREISEEEKKLIKQIYEDGLKQSQYNKTALNTLIVVLLLFYISFLSMNLDPHFESVRYPEDTEPIYTKKTKLVRNLPIIIRLNSKIIEEYYFLLSLNFPT